MSADKTKSLMRLGTAVSICEQFLRDLVGMEDMSQSRAYEARVAVHALMSDLRAMGERNLDDDVRYSDTRPNDAKNIPGAHGAYR